MEHIASRRLQQSRLYCICIDCAFVTNCTAYHFVETKHEQPHMTESPTFEPVDGSPTIHVNIRSSVNSDTMKRLWTEHKEETRQAEAKAVCRDDASPLRGETVYDLTPQTTYEYDVVACKSFVQDTGCWIRNMPEEIRRVNPDFVPT